MTTYVYSAYDSTIYLYSLYSLYYIVNIYIVKLYI